MAILSIAGEVANGYHNVICIYRYQSDEMPKRDEPFTAIVRATLATTPIVELLQRGEAVILERMARGGGATKWYYCRGQSELSTVEELLSPGGVVSFYFDERIRYSRYSRELEEKLEEAIENDGEVVVGLLGKDGTCIDATVVVSREDVSDFISAIDPASELFYGTFPGRDNDGKQAVTVTLPDNDGIVRPHPH